MGSRGGSEHSARRVVPVLPAPFESASRRKQPGSRDNDSVALSTQSRSGSVASLGRAAGSRLRERSAAGVPGMRSLSLASLPDAEDPQGDDPTSTPAQRLIRLIRPLKHVAADSTTRQRVDRCLDILYNTSDLYKVDYDKLLASPVASSKPSAQQGQASGIDPVLEGPAARRRPSIAARGNRQHSSLVPQASSRSGSIGSVGSKSRRHTSPDDPERSTSTIPGQLGAATGAGMGPRQASKSTDSSKRGTGPAALDDENTRKWLATQLTSGAPTSGKAQVRGRKRHSSRRRLRLGNPSRTATGNTGAGSSLSRSSLNDVRSHASTNNSTATSGRRMRMLRAASTAASGSMASATQHSSMSSASRHSSHRRLRPMGSEARMVTTRMSQQQLFRAHSLSVLNKAPAMSFHIPGMAVVGQDGSTTVVDADEAPEHGTEADAAGGHDSGDKLPLPRRYTLHARHASMPHMRSFVAQMPLVQESAEESVPHRDSAASLASSEDDAAPGSGEHGSEKPPNKWAGHQQGTTGTALPVHHAKTSVNLLLNPEGPTSMYGIGLVRAISAADVFEELQMQASPQTQSPAGANGPGAAGTNAVGDSSSSSKRRSSSPEGSSKTSSSQAGRGSGSSAAMDMRGLLAAGSVKFPPSGEGSVATAFESGSQQVESARIEHSQSDLLPCTYLDLSPQTASVIKALKEPLRWNFDIFALEGASGRRPLALLGNRLLEEFGCVQQYSLPEPQRSAFLNTMEYYYCFDPQRRNPYHCSTHAADVTQGVAHFLSLSKIKSIANSLDSFALLFAAMIHDFRHPGCSNSYLVSTSHDLALRYNDESVLEHYHTSEGFQLLHHPRYNMMVSLEDEERRRVRYVAIQAIKVTDLSTGAHLVNTFKSKLATTVSLGKTSEEDRQLVLNMVLKCSDVSHPARPLHSHLKWTDLITEEFYRQGDCERRLGLPISPLCDRGDHNLPHSQLGFIQFVVRPSYAVFAEFLGSNEELAQLDANMEFWEREKQANLEDEEAQPLKQRMTEVVIDRRGDEDRYRGPGGYYPLQHLDLLPSEVEAHKEAREVRSGESGEGLDLEASAAAAGGGSSTGGAATAAERGGVVGDANRQGVLSSVRRAEYDKDDDDDDDDGHVVLLASDGQIDDMLARMPDEATKQAQRQTRQRSGSGMAAQAALKTRSGGTTSFLVTSAQQPVDALPPSGPGSKGSDDAAGSRPASCASSLVYGDTQG